MAANQPRGRWKWRVACGSCPPLNLRKAKASCPLGFRMRELLPAPSSPRAPGRPRKANARRNVVSLRLTDEQAAELERVASAVGLPPSKAAAVAVARWLNQMRWEVQRG